MTIREHMRVVRATGLALVAGALVTVASANAQAQSSAAQRFRLHLEGGAGTMFGAFQRQVLGYSRYHFVGRAQVSVEFTNYASLQVGASTGWFFAAPLMGTTQEQEAGRMTLVGGGARFFPKIYRSLSALVDVMAGAGLMPNGVTGAGSGMLTRFAFDVGVGAHIDVASFLAITPIIRYHHVLQDAAQRPRPDAQYWTASLGFTFRIPEGEAQTRPADEQRAIDRGNGVGSENNDQDNDGVLDSLDQCPDQPANGNNDRLRLGCPAFDSDRDGVNDNVDQCPQVAQGPQPHPTRSGCPDGDNDHDGVGNSGDQCVEQFQGFFANRAAPGCPPADRDRDMIPDDRDTCPDRAGSPSTNTDRNGCAGIVRLEQDALRTTEAIAYAADAATLDPRSERVLTALSDAIASVPAIRRIIVVVPERLPGDTQASATLAEERGRDLVRRLVADGIDAARLGSRSEPLPEPVRGRRAEPARIYLSITQVISPPVR
ncbi:MAG: thrombospondin type 3 repeat-containing protein [Deltaproteobacteria bacterium]|nr:thrombospondin type 3 repeat-containing protein [Deltaproteobacteria bacterium]